MTSSGGFPGKSDTLSELSFVNAPLRHDQRRVPRIVAIGGGTGLPAVLEGLCSLAAESGVVSSSAVTAVVTVTDDGGSSGKLRREFGVLPPGDVRNCLAAFADPKSPFRRLLQHRLDESAHPLGNLLLTALTQITGSFPDAVNQLGEMMGLRGRVLPTTGENVRLRAEMDSGQVLTGETSIVERRLPIRRLSLDPSPRPLPEVLQALVNADAIVIGPGSLYTSTLPNLLVEGIASTISAVTATRIYVANLMTEPGETDGFSLDDHLRVIREHTGFDLFDYIVVNKRELPEALVSRYRSEGSQPVRYDAPLRWAGRARVVEMDFGCEAMVERGKIRHEPSTLAQGLHSLIDDARRLPAAS
jgi:uncharacterized cofD-like protein